MFIIYDLIFLVIALIYLPLYLFRGKFHRDFLARLGILPKNLKLDRPIWLHAVSVGEVLAAKGLIESLRQEYPGKQLVITTVTTTGNKIARTLSRQGDFVTYLPLDFSFATHAFIEKIAPSLAIIVETELWPNLILTLSKKGIPVLVVNARISDHSFRGYLRIKFLIKPLLKRIDLFSVQSGRDAERLLRLGAPEEKIRINGNMKFDIMDAILSGQDAEAKDNRLKQQLRLTTQEKFFVVGSTHPGEEEIVLRAYEKVLLKSGGLRLLLAPRHPERAAEVEKVVSRYGFQPLRISQVDTDKTAGPRSVFILDTIGQLESFYRIADIVFVGGSLVKKGGHNILEPAAFGKPIICGPYMFNFRDIAGLFISNNASVTVNDGQGLESAVLDLLDNPGRSQQLGSRAKDLVTKNRGATLKNMECIKELLKN